MESGWEWKRVKEDDACKPVPGLCLAEAILLEVLNLRKVRAMYTQWLRGRFAKLLQEASAGRITLL